MTTRIATLAKCRKAPTYRLRPDYGQAIVTLTDAVTGKRKDYWLGEHDSSASREAYHRVIAEWESSGRRLPHSFDRGKPACTLAVNELIHAYKGFVEVNYRRPSQQTIYMALRVLRQFYGMTPADDFGPKRLRLLREQMVKGDLAADPPRKPWSRPTTNKAVHQVVALFKWAASHEMLPATVYEQLRTVTALRRGRSAAREADPVGPVSLDHVNAVRPYLSRQVSALIDLQLHTGARGGELFNLRAIDITMDDRDGIWTISPTDHKTAHHGHTRMIFLGPKAQAVIRPFLAGRAVDAYLFSPAEAEQERLEARAAARKTPLTCGNIPGSNKATKRKHPPGDHYTAASYRRAIERACRQANVRPWHPHQLRHTAATLIRREFGLEAARIALGHSSALVTDAVYAERDAEKVVEVMRKIG